MKFVHGGVMDINIFDYRVKIIDLKVEIGLLGLGEVWRIGKFSVVILSVKFCKQATICR